MEQNKKSTPISIQGEHGMAGEQGEHGYILHGVNQEFAYSREHEIVLSGPYCSGKTIAILKKIHLFCNLYPETKCLLTSEDTTTLSYSSKKTYEDLILDLADNETEQILSGKILKQELPCGTEYIYPNKSSVICIPYIGDIGRANIISRVFDFIYIGKMDEISEANWDFLKKRTLVADTKRYPRQIIGEFGYANSNKKSYKEHWIHSRENIQIYATSLKDNPTLYDTDLGQWTEEGKRTIKLLDALALSPLERERQVEGKWV